MSALISPAIADRRRFRRSSFSPPLCGNLGDTTALLIELSVASAVVEHELPLTTGHPLRLEVDWYERIVIDTRPLRTERTAGERLRSILEVVVPTGSLVRSLALHVSSSRIARLESLVAASKLINSAIDPDALIEALLTLGRAELGVHGVRLYFIDRSRDEIWTDVPREDGPVVVRFPIESGIAGYVARTGEALVLESSFLDARFDSATDLVSPFRTSAMLCVPVRDRMQNVVGVLQFLHQEHRSFVRDDFEFVQGISEHVAIAMQNAALVLDRIEKIRMNAELELASGIQERLLPRPPEAWCGVDVVASSTSCFEVGGDYHDFIDLPDGDLGLAIGDVSGKGVAAALIMSSAQAALRIAAPTGPDLAVLITRLDDLLYRTTPNERFVTFFFGRYSRRSRILRYVNAGHNPPIVCSRGSLVRLEATGPPLGILQAPHFVEAEIHLEPGATLVLYTDGFCEAADAGGKELGTKAWEALVLGSATEPVPVMARLLTDAVSRYEDGSPPSDDKTLVIFRPHE